MLVRRLFVLLLCLVLVGCSGRTTRLHLADRDAFATMMTAVATARVVFVGEFHDHRAHHQLQLEVIRELQRRGFRLAIGLEMFDLEQQPVLDEWVRGKMTLQEFVARYQQAWNIAWAEYDTIILFARNNGIPLVALDAPADIVRAVTHGGAQSLGTGTEAYRRLPAGTTTTISAPYRNFMSAAFRTHAIPDAMFDNFCAAQGVRNSTMARRITGFLKHNPDRTMVVIAGLGHSMRRAVPSLIIKEGVPTKIVLPFVDGLYEELDRDDMDYLVTFDE